MSVLWCRFQNGGKPSYGIVEGDRIIAVEGDPFSEYRRTAQSVSLADSKLLVPVVPPTFYAIGSNYKNHVVGRAEVKGEYRQRAIAVWRGQRHRAEVLRTPPRRLPGQQRAHSDRRSDRQAEECWRQFRI